MTHTPRLSACVEKGRLRWRDVLAAVAVLSKLEGCDVDVSVAKHQHVHEAPPRSRGGDPTDPTDPNQCHLHCARCHQKAHAQKVAL